MAERRLCPPFGGFGMFLSAPVGGVRRVVESVRKEARTARKHGALWLCVPLAEKSRIGLLPPAAVSGGPVAVLAFAVVPEQPARAAALSEGEEGGHHG